MQSKMKFIQERNNAVIAFRLDCAKHSLKAAPTQDISRAVGDITALRVALCILPILHRLNNLYLLFNSVIPYDHQRGGSSQEASTCETRDSS